MTLPKILSGGFSDADIIAQRLAHFIHPVQPFQQRHGKDHLGFLLMTALQVPAHEQD